MDFAGVAVVAAGIVIFTLVSGRIQDSMLTGPMLFTAFGFVVGDAVFGIVRLDFGHAFVHGLAEVTLIFVLFSDAARIDLRQVRRQNLPIRLLAIGLPLIIVAGTLIGWLLPLGLGFWQVALLAAILAPTDAALGQSVVASVRVPVRIRQALNIESGLNDGIALPVVLLFAALAGAGASASESPSAAFVGFVAAQLILGPVVGLIVGWGGAWLIDRAARFEWMSTSAEGAAILGLALLSFAAAEIVEGNGFIAAFVSGMVFGNRVRDRCSFLFEFIEAEGHLLVLLTFLIFGGAIVPGAIAEIGWEIVLYAVLSLTVVRMIPVAISLTGTGLKVPSIVFLGWFGPRGLASILFALLVLEEMDIAGAAQISVITIATVVLSILAHGVTAAIGARWYGGLVEKAGDCEEINPVSELPTRTGLG